MNDKSMKRILFILSVFLTPILLGAQARVITENSLALDESVDGFYPLQSVRTVPLSGVVCPGQKIDVSSISRGLYVLKAMDSEGKTHEFKFMKSN